MHLGLHSFVFLTSCLFMLPIGAGNRIAMNWGHPTSKATASEEALHPVPVLNSIGCAQKLEKQASFDQAADEGCMSLNDCAGTCSRYRYFTVEQPDGCRGMAICHCGNMYGANTEYVFDQNPSAACISARETVFVTKCFSERVVASSEDATLSDQEITASDLSTLCEVETAIDNLPTSTISGKSTRTYSTCMSTYSTFMSTCSTYTSTHSTFMSTHMSRTSPLGARAGVLSRT